MRKYTSARRGTSLAAAALSLALLAPAVQPVALPASGTSALAATAGVDYPGNNAAGVYTTPPKNEAKVYKFTGQRSQVPGAIESTSTTNADHTVSGYVINQRQGGLTVGPGDERAIPMSGVRVYAQWIEPDSVVSPVYTATTGADGTYAIGMKSFKDVFGTDRTFDPDGTAQGDQIRVWADNPDTTTFQEFYGYMAGKIGPVGDSVDNVGLATDTDGNTPTTGYMEWDGAKKSVKDARFAFGEKQQNELMHDFANAKETAPHYPRPDQTGGTNYVEGQVFWEMVRPAGTSDYDGIFKFNGEGDVPAVGVTVYSTYLSHQAVKRIVTDAASDLGFTISPEKRWEDPSWTAEKEARLQNWIRTAMKNDPSFPWIAETVKSTTGDDGIFTTQFNGQVNGTNEIGASPEAGTWGREDGEKHVNMDWLYVSTEPIEGVAIGTPWHANFYLPMNGPDGYNLPLWPARDDAPLYADNLLFDISPYNSYGSFAKPADVKNAKVTITGLPTKFADDLAYDVVWYRSYKGEDGTVHKDEILTDSQKGLKPDASGAISLDAGEEIVAAFPEPAEGDTFIADLYPVNAKTGQRGDRIASDSFSVKNAPAAPDAAISSRGNGKCGDALRGWGIAAGTLIPLGLLANLASPSVEAISGQFSEQIRQANAQLQQHLGIMNPEMARQAAQFDEQLRTVGADLGTVGAGIAIAAVGIAAIASIAADCSDRAVGASSSTAANRPAGSSANSN